jgi:NDP-sugar pyrophosphorylase family protein
MLLASGNTGYMVIKDLIKALQDLYATYDAEYFQTMGEPEIMIDVFKSVEDHKFAYQGYGRHIVIEKSKDGVYDILSAFSETQDQAENKVTQNT